MLASGEASGLEEGGEESGATRELLELGDIVVVEDDVDTEDVLDGVE